MQIAVNGEPRSLGDGATVTDLTALFELTPERAALEAGHLAFHAGRIPRKLYATASSPMEGRIAPVAST